MLLHTAQPAELIFPPDPQYGGMTTVKIEGKTVMGMRTDGCLRVSRLLSTDPSAFLDPRFAPGSQILLDSKHSDFAAF